MEQKDLTQRELRFRAWSTAEKVMVDSDASMATIMAKHIKAGRGLQNGNGQGSTPGDYIIQQFTGLKDKNGKEIYEGDILEPGWFDGEYYVVVFNDGRFAEQRRGSPYADSTVLIMDGSMMRSDKLQVIGNIYEGQQSPPNPLLGDREMEQKDLTATPQRVRGTHVYLGVKSCGCGVAVVIDDETMRDELPEILAEYIREGLTIERIPLDDFKPRFKGCKCGKLDLQSPQTPE